MEEVVKQLSKAFGGFLVHVYPRTSDVPSGMLHDLSRLHQMPGVAFIGVAGKEFGRNVHGNGDIAFVLSQVETQDGQYRPVRMVVRHQDELKEKLGKLSDLLKLHDLKVVYSVHRGAECALVTLSRDKWHGWLGSRQQVVALLQEATRKKPARQSPSRGTTTK